MIMGTVTERTSKPADAAAPGRPAPVTLLQRKCACGGSAGVNGECEECAKKRLSLRRKESGAGPAVAPPIVHDVLRSPGQSLDGKTFSFMASRFGHDFSRVRVHTDARAAESARSVNALAYTVGSSVVFGAGQYAPHTLAGQRLLAHELAHVVQQRGSAPSGEIPVGGEHDSSEREAERAESGISGAGALSMNGGAWTLRRAVRRGSVSCRNTGLINPNLTGDEAVAAIEAADAGAIALANDAERRLQANLDSTRAGDPVDAAFDALLQEELGLTLTNPAHFRLIEQQIRRFRQVRETLESGFLRYMCRGGTVNLQGCLQTSCEPGDFGFSCPANRLMVLCQEFWSQPAERAGTILHETFHIRFSMVHENTLRRANAFCFEAFARRLAGEDVPEATCRDGAH